MPEIPRDPRQLARDILAGKVRIEDLQRERQRRGGALPPVGERTPARIPLPRQAPPQPPMQRPMQRGPMPPQRMPQQQRPVPQRPPVRMPPQIPVPARKPLEQLPAEAAPVRVEQNVSTTAEAAPTTRAEAIARTRRGLRLGDLVKSKHALRQGIVLAEVLGKPVSMRDEM